MGSVDAEALLAKSRCSSKRSASKAAGAIQPENSGLNSEELAHRLEASDCREWHERLHGQL